MEILKQQAVRFAVRTFTYLVPMVLGLMLMACASARTAQIQKHEVSTSDAFAGAAAHTQSAESLLQQLKNYIQAAGKSLADAISAEHKATLKSIGEGQTAFASVESDDHQLRAENTALEARVKKLDSQFFSPKQVSIWHILLIALGIMFFCWCLMQIAPYFEAPYRTILSVVGHIGTLGIPIVSKLLSAAAQAVAAKLSGATAPIPVATAAAKMA